VPNFLKKETLLCAAVSGFAAPAAAVDFRTYTCPSSWVATANGFRRPVFFEIKLARSLSEILSKNLPPSNDHLSRIKRAVYFKGVLHRLHETLFAKGEAVGDLPAHEFLAHLQPGVVYNVVVIGDRIILAATGAGFFQDLFSKHAVVADFADLPFAGTMWLETIDQQTTLVLSDESGSYRTPWEFLAPTAAFLTAELGAPVVYRYRR